MEVVRYEIVLEAQSPVAHHSEVFGNSAIAMRRRIRQGDGTFAEVPVITGDTMRHGLREASSYALLDASNMLDRGSLGEAALRLLFAGGMITGRGDGSSVKLDQYREMVELVPPLALFGGCANNRAIPGRLVVEDAILICDESMRYVPGWVGDWIAGEGGTLDSSRAHIEEVQRVRMDPTLDPGKRKLLSDGADGKVQERLVASEAAHDGDNAIARESTKSTMLPRRFERIAQGSLFYWSVEATCYSDLDLDTFNTAVGVFLSNARVGGKRATGHGMLRAVKAQKVVLSRPAERTEAAAALAPKVGELFRAHVSERADRVREFLAAVDA